MSNILDFFKRKKAVISFEDIQKEIETAIFNILDTNEWKIFPNLFLYQCCAINRKTNKLDIIDRGNPFILVSNDKGEVKTFCAKVLLPGIFKDEVRI